MEFKILMMIMADTYDGDDHSHNHNDCIVNFSNYNCDKVSRV